MLETEQQRMQDESELAAMSTSTEHIRQASLSPLGQSSTVVHAKVALMGISQSPGLGARTNFFCTMDSSNSSSSFIVHAIMGVNLNKNDVTEAIYSPTRILLAYC